jgi:dTDP-4-amino-4,6-dideoxygalactose transaminase
MASSLPHLPLVDLGAQHRQVADEIARGFARVLEKTAFILGEDVKRFEDAFATFTGAKHCIGVGNGTDALELALRAVGVGPGDEVIIPTNTFVATPLAAARAGAVPVFVDCDPETYLLDVEEVAAKITPRTRAVMPVDLYGQVAPMERLAPLAEEHGLKIIEDAAQAQGAKRHGRGAGTFGDAAGTSFYPGKNLGAYGDAGAVLTGSDEVAAKVRALRNYGSAVKYHHPETGFNSRLDTLQAVVLNAKLERLAAWNQGRREAATRYDRLLAEAALPGVTGPRTLDGNEHVWHLYVVRVPRRDDVLKKLNAEGIGAGIHYPVPCHLQGAFKHLGIGPGAFPVSEKAAGEILSLPMFGEITAEQQARVVDALGRALR